MQLCTEEFYVNPLTDKLFSLG